MMQRFSRLLAFVVLSVALVCTSVQAREIGDVNTAFNIGGSDKIVVESIKDDDISGVTCHISYAKKGGFLSAFAEDPSRFSIACRQTGPIVVRGSLTGKKEVAAFKRSALFKSMNVLRMYDEENTTVIYLVYATKVIDGSPFNSISSVPLMPWGTAVPSFIK